MCRNRSPGVISTRTRASRVLAFHQSCHTSELENHTEQARQATDESTLRTWRLYMARSSHFVESLLAKATQGNSGMPLTRADWYC